MGFSIFLLTKTRQIRQFSGVQNALETIITMFAMVDPVGWWLFAWKLTWLTWKYLKSPMFNKKYSDSFINSWCFFSICHVSFQVAYIFLLGLGSPYILISPLESWKGFWSKFWSSWLQVLMDNIVKDGWRGRTLSSYQHLQYISFKQRPFQ